MTGTLTERTEKAKIFVEDSRNAEEWEKALHAEVFPTQEAHIKAAVWGYQTGYNRIRELGLHIEVKLGELSFKQFLYQDVAKCGKLLEAFGVNLPSQLVGRNVVVYSDPRPEVGSNPVAISHPNQLEIYTMQESSDKKA